ncbi:MAG TPA: hypothetical protein VFU89_08445, partial [Rhabdochlamydiaceae bacterium]|nr:hypothetical protein [Rhabdochlamydiaceae bacterium]
MTTRAVAKPNWDILPALLTPPWYDSPKIRQIVSGVFALMGAGFGTSFYFTTSLSRFLLLGLAVASVVVARRALAAPQDKNAMALTLRQKAGTEIEKSGTFKNFHTKYRDLISKKILQPIDINFVVERDVQALDYGDFLTKHADASCKIALMDALQPASRELLQAKCLVMLAANPAQTLDEADYALLDRKTPRANEQALVAKDWNEFIRNGRQSAAAEDPAAVEALKRLFLAKAYRREIEPTVICHYFSEEEQKSIKKTMIIFELELVADGQLPLSELKWCYVQEEGIVDEFSQMNAKKLEPLKQKFRDHYLTTFSSDQLKSEGFKKRREVCGITPEMIDHAQGPLRADCRQLPYLGAEGFRKKYGNKHLNDGSLTPELIDKIKAEFRAALPTAESISSEIYDDALILELGAEILVPRWMKMPLKDLWNNEKGIFLD